MVYFERIIDRVVAGSGLNQEAAEQTCHAVSRALGHCLADPELVARWLPPQLRDDVLASGPAEECDLDGFYACVAAELDQPFGRAVEHAQIVATAVAACLEPGELPMLTSHLPPAIAELFRRPAPGQPPPRRAPRGTLAGGVSGSQRPISSARPPGADPEVTRGLRPISSSRPPGAQSDSIAASNPHADRKLSSSTPSSD